MKQKNQHPTEQNKAVVRTLELLVEKFAQRSEGSILYTGCDAFQFNENQNIRDAMHELKKNPRSNCS